MKNAIRLAIITSHIKKSYQWECFSKGLNKRKIYHIHIILEREKPVLYDDLVKNGVMVYFLKYHNFLSYFIFPLKIIKILLKHSINVVHTELPHGNLFGQLSAFIIGIKARVSTCENASWGYDYNCKKQIFIDKLTYKLSKKIIALTSISKNYLIEKFNIPEHKIIVIGHSINIDDFIEPIASNDIKEYQQKYGIQDNDFVVGMVARFEEWKGHIYVIEAIRILRDKYSNIKLLIFGQKGEYYESIVNAIKKYELEKNVIIAGFCENPKIMYKLLDVQVHVPINSLAETFGITIIEAMASGCPIILTRSGVANDIAVNDYNCVVVDFKNTNDIVKAIEKIMLDKNFKTFITKNAQDVIRKKFNFADKVDNHINIYRTLLCK